MTRADLLAAIQTTGRLTPCAGSLLWISSKPTVQARAAEACGPCAVFWACRQFGLDHPDEIGIYGGLVPANRKPSRAPARGKTTERIAS